MIKNWSAYVTKHSFALDLEEGIFTWNDPKKIARSLKRSAKKSAERKAGPFQSAMSMLNFYINRAGKNLSPKRRRILDQAKIELRKIFGKNDAVFRKKVFNVVKKIPRGKFLSYKKIAKLAGRPKAFRAAGNILAGNKDVKIPCYRVVKNDNSVGGLYGDKKLDWQKAALLLKEGAIGVIPTDTIYGICGSASNKKTVEKIYKLRKRSPDKPFIVLIGSVGDLKKFGVNLSGNQKKFLIKCWPGKISAILKCSLKKFVYLHRGMKTIAFRMPKNALLKKILKNSGPLVAPSANYEGKSPAKNIKEAKKYFKDKVFYLNRGDLVSKPSTLIDLIRPIPKILRP